jgi:type IV pilus biogenesis protein CpaD/CtpE
MHRTPVTAFAPLAAGLALLALLSGCASPREGRAPSAADAACLPWVEFPASPRANRDLNYVGCTNEENLRSMVAVPEDLQHGRALGPASGERESLGVERYNLGKAGPEKSAGSASPTIIMPAAGGGASQ